VLIKENLEIILATVPEVFIAADLLWYPVEGEQPAAPQVVFDILSESNRTVQGHALLFHQ
jgi:hypothetical protein